MTRVGDLGGTRMAEHKCGTCKHYEPAPMWKKGWCRNPLLFSPQQSHLVGEEDLDCNRGMGSYWEPIESEAAEDLPLARFTPPPRTIAPAGQEHYAGPQQATQVGPTRRERAPQPQVTAPMPRPRVRRPEPLATDSPETYAAPPPVRSWGEYLRISVPAIGVVLLLGAFWIYSSTFFSRRPQAPATTAPIATVPANLGQVTVIVPSPTAAPAGAAAANGAAPAATFPPPPPGKVAPGAAVVVQSAGDGANIRAQPSINAAVTTAVASGTALTVTGASQDADGYTWWPVKGDGFSGWIAGGLLVPAH